MAAPIAPIYIGLDIETAGACALTHPVVSIGVCVGDAEGVVLEKFRIDLKARWFEDFEPRCVDEFWSKQPHLRALFDTPQAVTQEEGFRRFAAWLDALEMRWPADRFKIYFVTDNPTFDIPTLNVQLERYAGRMPLQYSTTNKYRPIKTTLLREFDKTEAGRQERERIAALVTHDHDPSNDAYHILLSYLAGKRLMEQAIAGMVTKPPQ